MAVQQAAVGQDRTRGPGRRARWSRRWPLLAEPAPLAGYVTVVLACDLALIGWELTRSRPHPGDLLLFAALLICGALCIEATRRLGVPAGVSRDLLSAWWLPIALLLPPLCALAAPLLLSLLLQLRVRRTAIYRRVFSAAALGLSGAAASIVFGRFGLRPGTERNLVAWFTSSGPGAWFTHPVTVAIAIGCAALFSVLNAALVAVAAHAAEPLTSWRAVLWDSESLILDVTEVCVGVLVTIACVLSPLLLFVALPPVILLQRSLLHQQLRAAARTDAKTGLLNAAAWQREADTEISRVLRSRQPLGLLLVDVDHFKRVNDTHGHLTGDQVLAALAGVLSQHVRGCDVVGRFGGEEFVVLLPGAEAAESVRIAERLREQAAAMATAPGGACAGPTGAEAGPTGARAGLPGGRAGVPGGRAGVPGARAGVPGAEAGPPGARVAITVSIGAAVLGVHGSDLQGLLAAADLALYRAKAGGRNRVCLPGRPEPASAPTAPAAAVSKPAGTPAAATGDPASVPASPSALPVATGDPASVPAGPSALPAVTVATGDPAGPAPLPAVTVVGQRPSPLREDTSRPV